MKLAWATVQAAAAGGEDQAADLREILGACVGVIVRLAGPDGVLAELDSSPVTPP
jgi:hypothetical protein